MWQRAYKTLQTSLMFCWVFFILETPIFRNMFAYRATYHIHLTTLLHMNPAPKLRNKQLLTSASCLLSCYNSWWCHSASSLLPLKMKFISRFVWLKCKKISYWRLCTYDKSLHPPYHVFRWFSHWWLCLCNIYASPIVHP